MKTAIANFIAWLTFTAMALMWSTLLLIERGCYWLAGQSDGEDGEE